MYLHTHINKVMCGIFNLDSFYLHGIYKIVPFPCQVGFVLLRFNFYIKLKEHAEAKEICCIVLWFYLGPHEQKMYLFI